MGDDLNVLDSNGRVLVNVNHPNEDPSIYLLPFISRHVKPHQIGGIRFIYDNIVESLGRVKIKDTGFGCILAHAMGLGKTLQTISFIEIFLRCKSELLVTKSPKSEKKIKDEKGRRNSKDEKQEEEEEKPRVLCIVPINTIQ